MAAADAKTIIVLTPGHEIPVLQSAQEVQGLIRDAPRGDLAFMHVVDAEGRDHWLNVREIIEFYEPAFRLGGFSSGRSFGVARIDPRTRALRPSGSDGPQRSRSRPRPPARILLGRCRGNVELSARVSYNPGTSMRC